MEFKISIFGFDGSGKTSIVSRFINNTFNDSYWHLFIEDIFEKQIEIN